MFVVFGWQYSKSQQPASLQLQDIEDTSNDSTFLDDVTLDLGVAAVKST